jgi:glycerate kinase
MRRFSSVRPRLLAAPDKFKGSASARDVAFAIAKGASACGWSVDEAAMADGGEGTVEAFGGFNRSTLVHNPLGRYIDAPWRLDGQHAVIEMAAASGLQLVGGAAGNDPLLADTTGTGELIAAAAKAGARQIVVAMGGSASTDGGAGCVAAAERALDDAIDLVGAYDVTTRFLEAAAEFGPQKGASADQVGVLAARLGDVARGYMHMRGVDVRNVPGSGAAGGLGGGILALGGRLVAGFELVADHLDLERRVESADLVITGEGRFDQSSLEGKVVGEVLRLCERHCVPGFVVAGSVEGHTMPNIRGLVGRFGERRAFKYVLDCVTELTVELLVEGGGRSRG